MCEAKEWDLAAPSGSQFVGEVFKQQSLGLPLDSGHAQPKASLDECNAVMQDMK